MQTSALNTANFSPWPHRWAVALVCATFPLIWVGGLVTTYQAGMAVPDWPTTNGYNLFLYPWQTWIDGPWDLFIEHGHRLLGALAGVLTLALCGSLWVAEPRGWVRGLGVLAVVAVIGQGLLGGMRVVHDEQQLAKIHGCFGPAFFALCVSLSVITSRRWHAGPGGGVRPSAGAHQRASGVDFGQRSLQWQSGSTEIDSRPLSRGRHNPSAVLPGARWFQGLALLTAAFAYLQIVLGAHVRHLPMGTGLATFRMTVTLHLVLALVLSACIVILAVRAPRVTGGDPALTRPAWGLLAVLAGQLVLGSATWVTNYGWPAWFAGYDWAERYIVQAAGRTQAMATTAHVAAGSLILGMSTCLALRTCRLLRDVGNALRGVPQCGEPARNAGNGTESVPYRVIEVAR